MTRTTNARLAGFTYLFYIAVAFTSMVLFDRATSGEGIHPKLAGVAEHASDVLRPIRANIHASFGSTHARAALHQLE